MHPKYSVVTIKVHSMTTDDVSKSFSDLMNKHAEQGYRFVWAFNCGGNKYLLVFERMET